MKLNEAIIKIRVDLQNSKLHKSGKNKFAGFEYYELSDFLPTLNTLMMDNGVNDQFTIEDDYAILTLKKDDEVQSYKMPFTQFHTPTNKNGSPSMQDIQYLGALNTYYKRYLYLNAFGITDGEVIDSMDAVAPNQQASIEQVSQINKLLEETETDMITFLHFYKVKTVSELSSSNAMDAINKLNKKKGK